MRRVSEHQRERRAANPVMKWHARKIISHNGTLMISLPKKLLQWSREREGEPYRWSVGDHVMVAMTRDGLLVVQYLQEKELEDALTDQVRTELSWDYNTPPPPPQYRGDKRRGKVKLKQRDLRLAHAAEHSWAATNGTFVLWSDEVKRFRHVMGCTQREAAVIVGVAASRWNTWERKNVTPGQYRREHFRDRMKMAWQEKRRELKAWERRSARSAGDVQ